MPLPLDDSLWSELHSSYNGTEEVVSWLSEAYEQGGFSDERLGDLINEIMHQGGDSDAMYAVAPHLIELARKAEPREAINLLSHAGHIYMSAGSPNAIPCPEFLHDDFVRYGLEGAKLLSPLLRLAANFESYKAAVTALAGLMGHHSFARFLDGLDYSQGQCYHVLLEKPFPKEE